MAREKKQFFIIGYPRSGTTALARLLNASSHAACLYHEGNLLYRLWRMLSRRDILEEPHEDLVIDFEVTAKHNLIDAAEKAGCDKIVFKRSSLKRLVHGFQKDLNEETSKNVIYSKSAKRFFQLFPTLNGTKAVGDKVPDYINIPDVLANALPNSKIIYIYRDPRATIHSVLNFQAETLHLFALPSAFAMAFSYFMTYLGMKKFICNFPSNRLLAVPQEELKNDPHQIAGKICNFLQIPSCSEMLSWIKAMSQNMTIKNWKHEMKADDIKAVEAVADCMGVDLPGGPGFDPGCNGWLDKARSTTYLIDGTQEGVESALTDSRACFTSDEFYPLGLALVKIGDCHLSRGHFETAYPYYKTACSLIPDNPVLWFKFGELCFDMKLLNQSRNGLLKAHTLMPNVNYFNLLSAKTSYLLGRIERLSGKKSDATVWFERSLKSFPEFKLSQEMLKTQSR